jgi:hypothetical protein
MTIHNETDLLALTRAEKKLKHWHSLADKGVTVITANDDGTIYEVAERIIYWTKMSEKYRRRIERHIAEFEKINDFLGFARWISGIIETIRDIIKSLNIEL